MVGNEHNWIYNSNSLGVWYMVYSICGGTNCSRTGVPNKHTQTNTRQNGWYTT